jgi:CheY-like chemotaxis protein
MRYHGGWTGPSHPWEPVRILVVDDYELICRSLARSLRDHAVSMATSARSALELIQHGERFDAIICDAFMAEMDGSQLHEALVSIAPDQAPRMIFMSGKAEAIEANAYLRSLPNALIAKPFDIVELRRLIEIVAASV